jgi:hypothetical protein
MGSFALASSYNQGLLKSQLRPSATQANSLKAAASKSLTKMLAYVRANRH